MLCIRGFSTRSRLIAALIPLAVACGTAVSVSCTNGSACPCSDVPKPQSERKQLDTAAGLAFIATPAYKDEFASAVAGAKAALSKHQGEPNLAIVSDIDETLLDNSPQLARAPITDREAFGKWIAEAQAPALDPTAQLLSWARQQGAAVFLVTGRAEQNRRPTIENLIKRGVVYDGLFMRPDGDRRPAEVMKTEYRQSIEKMGFKIVVSIGDQDSDLWGGHAEDCEKLPNRIYYIP
jgi:hypothetical protein